MKASTKRTWYRALFAVCALNFVYSMARHYDFFGPIFLTFAICLILTLGCVYLGFWAARVKTSERGL